ncbi:MAG: helix-turn-helix domain-containing protein [Flammeovirgaceae bacterium]|nr:helix-turn-helix domain-containing protein [Flammeovirgaceae bacterium]
MQKGSFASEADNIQGSFLEQVRKKLSPNISLADELAEVLNISRDSAYRRIRGETILSLDEAKIICNKYKLSIDSLLSTNGELVSFYHRVAYHKNFDFDTWLKSILASLDMLKSFPQKEIIYYAKDLPIFHFFQFPRLAAFKIFFWTKTFAPERKMTGEKYDQSLVAKETLTLAERVWDRYSTIPSTELLSYECLNITLRHIEYAFECGSFSDRQEALDLCEDCARMMNNLKSQAENGLKTTVDSTTPGAPFNLYHNEVLIGDNSLLFKLGDKRLTFITHNNFNILSTDDPTFCKLTEEHIDNMLNKGTPISHTAEKERSKFFNVMQKKIDYVKRRIG